MVKRDSSGVPLDDLLGKKHQKTTHWGLLAHHLLIGLFIFQSFL